MDPVIGAGPWPSSPRIPSLLPVIRFPVTVKSFSRWTPLLYSPALRGRHRPASGRPGPGGARVRAEPEAGFLVHLFILRLRTSPSAIGAPRRYGTQALPQSQVSPPGQEPAAGGCGGGGRSPGQGIESPAGERDSHSTRRRHLPDDGIRVSGQVCIMAASHIRQEDTWL